MQPGMTSQALCFESADLVGLAQRERDVVETVDQAILAERLDIETDAAAVRRDDDLVLKVYAPLVAREGLDFIEQARHFEFGQDDRQQAILEAIVEENIRIRRRDDGAKAVLLQGPGRMLAAGTAAEILAREQDRNAFVARLVQDEIGVQ